MSEELFSTPAQQPSDKRPEPERDRYGRYLLTNPETGKSQSWQRTTTFAKMCSDTFNLTQWQMRNVAVGLGRRPDLLALAATLDISDDAKKLNDVCSQAKEAAGGSAAANTGTALHSFTEAHDEGRMRDVPEAYTHRLREYKAALDRAGIEILPEYIERVSVSTRWQVAGTYDRVVRLPDGTYAIFDLKTGKNLSYGLLEIAIQLAVYADCVNTAGVWNYHTGVWEKHPKVRKDFAIVAHLPAAGTGCQLYKIDLNIGRKGADLCAAVRDLRKLNKNAGEVWDVEPTPDALALENAYWGGKLAAAGSKAELADIAAKARGLGQWTPDLRELALKLVQNFS